MFMKTMENNRNKLVELLFKKLKFHGVQDPNVDLFLAVIENNSDLVEELLAQKKVDIDITDNQIIITHRKLLREIAPEELDEYIDIN